MPHRAWTCPLIDTRSSNMVIDTAPKHSDVLIIGAGSAGCVMANRLSADRNRRVTLVEAGGNDRHPMLRMPSAFYMPVRHRRFNWGYSSEPEPNLQQRRLLCPRGRVVGGSSSINGMVYVRGNPADFERWQQMGAKGWSYADVLPYFKKAQMFEGLQAPDDYRGHQGPLTVTDGALRNPLYQRFLDAAEQAGYPRRADLNDAEQEGFGPLPMTVNNGVRASAAQAYLHPASQRHNLSIRCHALTTRLLFREQRVVGAEVLARGRTQQLFADEVILCGGAINSPQLLLLSGIGPAHELAAHDIPVLLDLPGVGKNLMDHLEIYVQQACTQPISLYKDLGLFGRARIGAEWLLQRTGLGATNHFEAGGFIRSAPDQPYPDIQFHFLPAAMQYDGSARAQLHGYQAHVGPMLSASRGEVTLNSRNPRQHPRIRFNYMSDAQDWRVFRAAIRAARKLFSQAAFDDVRGDEIQPGTDLQSDDELDNFVRQHAESAYHPCGTCRMGEDAGAVVDATGKVHGLDGLRIVDASIFPHITNGNLNAPVIMAAEKIADTLV